MQRRDALVQKYLDHAAHIDKAASLEFVMTGNGNADIDAISDFKKEITGRGIQKPERVNLGHWQNALNSKIKNLSEPARVETDFYRDSKVFDQEHSKTDNGYWQSKVEMFARAFACYVFDSLDGRSDYLCGHSEAAVSITLVGGEPKVIAAIPKGEERTHINQCFDKLIAEMKDKGMLHHREDFSELCQRHAISQAVDVDFSRDARMAEIEAFDPNKTEQLSFEALIDNAFERADTGNFKGSKEKGIEK